MYILSRCSLRQIVLSDVESQHKSFPFSYSWVDSDRPFSVSPRSSPLPQPSRMYDRCRFGVLYSSRVSCASFLLGHNWKWRCPTNFFLSPFSFEFSYLVGHLSGRTERWNITWETLFFTVSLKFSVDPIDSEYPLPLYRPVVTLYSPATGRSWLTLCYDLVWTVLRIVIQDTFVIVRVVIMISNIVCRFKIFREDGNSGTFTVPISVSNTPTLWCFWVPTKWTVMGERDAFDTKFPWYRSSMRRSLRYSNRESRVDPFL